MTSQAERVAAPASQQPADGFPGDGYPPADASAAQSPAHDPVPDDGERDAFAEMFDEHAEHVFDYSCTLLADRRQAIRVTQLALITGHALAGHLAVPERRRAWLLALARRHGLSRDSQWRSVQSGAAAELAEALALLDWADDDVASPVTRELTAADIEAAGRRSLRDLLAMLPRAERELLDLAYRHGLSDADLPSVTGIAPVGAREGLAAAEAHLTRNVARDRAGSAEDAGDASGLPTLPAELAALPLADMPASIWQRTARVVMDPRFKCYREALSAQTEQLGQDGFPTQPEDGAVPSPRRLLLASALLAGLLLAPAAAGAAGYAVFAGSPTVANLHGGKTVVPAGLLPGSTPGAIAAGGHGHPKSSKPGSTPPDPYTGSVSSSPSASPRPSGAPSSKVSPSASPSPSPSASSSGPSVTSPPSTSPPTSSSPSPSPDPSPSDSPSPSPSDSPSPSPSTS